MHAALYALYPYYLIKRNKYNQIDKINIFVKIEEKLIFVAQELCVLRTLYSARELTRTHWLSIFFLLYLPLLRKNWGGLISFASNITFIYIMVQRINDLTHISLQKSKQKTKFLNIH